MNTHTSLILKLVALAILACVPLSGESFYVELIAKTLVLAISVVCIVLAVALYYVIQRTRLGMMIRAGNDDRGMVESLGININMIYRIVFALGVALAALAGMLASPISSVFPNMGSHVLIISFVIVVIGGIGSVWGALAAALIVGFADTFGKVLLPELSGMVVYIVMAGVLLWRPEGIFKKG